MNRRRWWTGSWLPGMGRLRSRLAVIVAAALTPAGVVAISQALYNVGDATKQHAEMFELDAREAVTTERILVNDLKQVIRSVAAAVRIELSTSGTCNTALASTREYSDWIRQAFVVSQSGDVSCGDNGAINAAETVEWREYVENPQYIIEIVAPVLPGDVQKVIVFTPLPSAVEPNFALVVSVETEYLRAQARQQSGLDVLALLNINHEVVLSDGTSDAETWLPEDRSRLTPYGDRRLRATGADGEQRHYFVSALESGQLWAVTAEKTPPLGDILLSEAGLSVALPIALWIIAIGVAFIAIDSLVTQHVSRLRRAALRIGQGDLETPVGDYSDAPVEIRSLGHALELMAENLSDRDTRLRENLELQKNLLLEVHHRVKNNLQMISSLINLESRRTTDTGSRAALKVIQERIHSLALVHQNLYAAENLKDVALDQLTRDISAHLEATFGVGRTKIDLDLDPVVADTNIATPIALFLTEAIGNAFKHAGPSDPEIAINLSRDETEFTLCISNASADDEPESDDNPESGLGLKLMSGFARQVDGAFEQSEQNGRYSVGLRAKLPQDSELFQIRRA